jgi:alpha/beta superfamily hydrolase
MVLLRRITIRLVKVQFQSDGLSLVGVLQIPDGEGLFPAVVICHPHPLYGGSMDNNVVNSLCDALVANPCITLKFNFRGVGGSQGMFSDGVGEQADVKAAISFVAALREADRARLGLAGYSAGAAWGVTAAYRDDRVSALAAVSPPLTLFDFNVLRDCRKPKLMICGSRDELIQDKALLDFCRTLPEPRECYIVEGADHSWWGHEKELAERVTDFFSKTL